MGSMKEHHADLNFDKKRSLNLKALDLTNFYLCWTFPQLDFELALMKTFIFILTAVPNG
jgi:hypothetical protein